ncbi:hypothetical protein SAMN03080617_01723 [Algoriphagus alkaliphilus]|uniref:Uncharacterized protein n=1 Tax=Algoriphagus alkaliphilus TaxID=279824 RepID=A0A1G5XEW7_9BACT|nr:hypothetical protein [Algoriphagus alkaliphilus]SDA68983.1 hypothetical protein SAMN03080617_01723 [Algoriphagus alkaliphilus]
MKWFLRFALFFICHGAYTVGDNTPELSGISHYSKADLQTETLGVFQFDSSDLIPAEARVRSTSNSSQRIKDDREFDKVEIHGLIFLTCRIAKSYCEIHIDKYLKQLIQYTIQVNAP